MLSGINTCMDLIGQLSAVANGEPGSHDNVLFCQKIVLL